MGEQEISEHLQIREYIGQYLSEHDLGGKDPFVIGEKIADAFHDLSMAQRKEVYIVIGYYIENGKEKGE